MKKLQNYFKTFLLTPGIYIALVIGTMIGGQLGALTGFVQGAYVGRDFLVLSNCSPTFVGYQLGFDQMHIVLGAVIGLVMGAIALGLSTGVVLSYAVFKNSNFSKPVTNENIQPIIRHCIILSLVLNSGMLFGAICGGLISPPLGSIIGAVIGFFLMSFVYFMYSKICGEMIFKT